MSTITIPKSVTGREELVVISRKEYERMKANMVPVFNLKGKAAINLDRRVEKALREHRAGKTESLGAFLKKEYPRLYKQYGR